VRNIYSKPTRLVPISLRDYKLLF